MIHINAVEHFTRLNSRFTQFHHLKITDAEASVRTEWTRLQQLEPGLSLSQIIDQVAKRHTIWPAIGEFRKQTKNGKGDAWPNTV